jgi:protein-disulfide isomerase
MTQRSYFTAATMLALAGLAACGDASDAKSPAPAAAPAAKPAAAPATPIPATTPGATNWLDVTVATPEGGFRVGNPNAKVKFLEFASLTCPHCREFHEKSMATLRSRYIASGKVSYEYRSFVLNGPDFAAALLARCQGAKPFFNLVNAFYEQQANWTEPFTKLTAADSAAIQALPQDQQIKAMAMKGGLDGFMKTRGMTSAKFNQCLTDKAAVDQLTAIRNDAVNKYQLTGTPTFVINGVTQTNVYTWEQLEPKLQAAVQ